MKHVLIATAFLVTAMTSLAHAQSESAAPITTDEKPSACATLQFTGLKSGEGSLLIAAYGNAETFLKKPLWMKSVKVDQGTMSVPICGIASPEIAVTAFQDMNGNGKLDSNPMGIPTEPYGASGTPAMFSAPTWKDTKVAFVDSTSPIIVKL